MPLRMSLPSARRDVHQRPPTVGSSPWSGQQLAPVQAWLGPHPDAIGRGALAAKLGGHPSWATC
eukprot:10160025-Alexandrium_andersonii.AAC.1